MDSFVHKIYYEDLDEVLQGGLESCTDIDDATITRVMERVRAMDGKRRTMVVLYGEDQTKNFLGIGGGKDGRFVVNHISQGAQSLLIDPTIPDVGLIEMVVGQADRYSPQRCVEISLVEVAVRTYFKDGSRDPSLTWLLCDEV